MRYLGSFTHSNELLWLREELNPGLLSSFLSLYPLQSHWVWERPLSLFHAPTGRGTHTTAPSQALTDPSTHNPCMKTEGQLSLYCFQLHRLQKDPRVKSFRAWTTYLKQQLFSALYAMIHTLILSVCSNFYCIMHCQNTGKSISKYTNEIKAKQKLRSFPLLWDYSISKKSTVLSYHNPLINLEQSVKQNPFFPSPMCERGVCEK